jgi:hypothetical protein
VSGFENFRQLAGRCPARHMNHLGHLCVGTPVRSWSPYFRVFAWHRDFEKR